jgi:hypothetical protein
MARKSARDDLIDKLRVGGLRKDVAKRVAGIAGNSRKPPKAVRGVLDSLKAVTAEIEDRATGGPGKRKAAAKKAAATRKRNAAKRSTAAKKGAKTRARASR